jgi:hypothetical protein
MLLCFSLSTVSCVYQVWFTTQWTPASLTQLWEVLESTWARIPVERLTPFRVHALTNLVFSEGK